MMHLNNYQFLKKKEKLVLFLLILFSVLIRIPIILIYGDTNLENEWAALVNNLISHGTLSYKSFEDFLLPNLLNTSYSIGSICIILDRPVRLLHQLRRLLEMGGSR